VAIPITLTCECGELHRVMLGDRVTCGCGREYDTSTLPPERFAHVRAKQARVRLYLQLSLIFVAAVIALTAIVWGWRGVALGAPLAALIWFLFLGKWYRRRWLSDGRDETRLTLEATER
jgi:hypothetical protein